jgi:hypothetical protein
LSIPLLAFALLVVAVMPADRVLALDAGEVVEFDSPSALLGITKLEEQPILHPKSGALTELVGRSGPDEELKFRSMAAAGFIRRRILVYYRAKKIKAQRKLRKQANGAILNPATEILVPDAELPKDSTSRVC